MPGYIMHLTEAQIVMEILEKKGYVLTDDWKNQFRLGALLPDTRRKREKITSHFWNKEDLVKQAIAPRLNKFLAKYEKDLSENPLMLGYYVHLHLDAMYVNGFWPEVLEFLDENGQPEALLDRIKEVDLKEKGIRIPLEKFFTNEYYYGDFDQTNLYFWEKYQLVIPKYVTAEAAGYGCPVEEVEYPQLQAVLSELSQMLTVPAPKEIGLKVFRLETLENFIRRTAEAAEELIRHYI